LQVSSFSQLPLQQSHDELQLWLASLQTAPFGLHPVGFWQTRDGASRSAARRVAAL
jgi:hypothetical protein